MSVSESFVTEANKENRNLPIGLVTIEHDDLDAPIYCTDNGEDVTSNGITFMAFPFDFVAPKQTRDGVEPGKLVISNISGTIVEACRTIAGAGPAKCTFQAVMPDDHDTVERQWPSLELRNVQYSTSTLTGSLCHPMFNTEPHTKYTACDKYFPSL